jgi:uncharacterized protein (DUF1684 family)
MSEYLELVDWRRRVGDLYRLTGPDAIVVFRRERDHLFATHPQSPIAAGDRPSFEGLSYFDPDPRYKVSARFEPADGGELVIETGGPDGDIHYERAGWLSFEVDGTPGRLLVLSLVAYGGGLFCPFRDATSGKQTYGGGRYLFDTPKDTDGLSLEIGAANDEVTIDFNFAYNPSCAYDPEWVCPLAPRDNWLDFAVDAGEKSYPGLAAE